MSLPGDGSSRSVRSLDVRLIVDRIPAFTWSAHADGSVEFVNQRWREYAGLSAEESQGWGWQAAIHREDLPSLMEKWRGLLRSGEPGDIEARMRRHDGVFRWFLIRFEPFRDETGKIVRWYGVSTEMEGLKEGGEKLREDERELRRITDAIPQTIVVLDPSGAPMHANQAALDYTGLTAEDVTSPRFRERIFHPEDLDRLRDQRKAALSRAVPFEVEQRARRKDGQYRWFLIHYNPFRNEQGQVIRWYATGTDIDDRVRAEERTRNENLALREQSDRDSMLEDIQIALLRVLQEREIERVGSSRPIPVDVRVVAATHRDLNALVAEGNFRQDLLYRLNVVPIRMPPLRERAADMSLLVEYFIDRFGKRAGKKFRTIDKKLLKAFQTYGWPGNVRELQNVIERAVILSEGDNLAVDETWLRREQAPAPSRTATLGGTLVRHEKEMIEAALKERQGRISGPGVPAEKIGPPAKPPHSTIKTLKINHNQFKVPQG